MNPALGCEAIKAKCRVEINYSGRARVIEAHAVGYTRDDKAIMRAWQVRGGSAGGDSSGWKLLRLDEIRHQRCWTRNLKRHAPATEKVTLRLQRLFVKFRRDHDKFRDRSRN